MLTKIISVSKTRFQNTKTVLKNQQASIQGLKTQIGQLAKLISDRPQGSLPSNTETNPREQLHVITIQHEEGLVESKLDPRQETVIEELDKWRTHVKEEPKIHKAKSKQNHGEHKDEMNQFKVGDRVWLDKKDPRIINMKLNANGATPFTVLNVFPYGTVEVTHSHFGTFKVNSSRLKPYLNKGIDNEKEEFRLHDPP
ncbi:hypothetical protein GOBAR_AA05244 [Gossypium barbadense]|uniref:Uncharacterized protein n=1 Tax=Gossypium barbadense TaxID=3634 RepID=A0A2P5YIB4_GOSBA|nr:hypothetical protein GOBAR_AA05244 [Gossypium barbadense]